MKKLTQLIIKYPIKTLLFTFLVIMATIIGVLQVNLNTGNDTLISDDTEIYQNNEDYQMEFGKDPIIIIAENLDPFHKDSIDLFYLMHEAVKDMDGIFSINSPVTLIEQMSINMYNETETGLLTISTGLSQMADQLEMLSTNLNPDNQEPALDIQALVSQIENLITLQNQLGIQLINIYDVIETARISIDSMIDDMNIMITELDGDPLRVDELNLANQTLTELNALDDELNMLAMTDDIINIPAQTSQVLQVVLSNFSTLSTMLSNQNTAMSNLSASFLVMSSSLDTIAINLNQIQSNFNAFEPGFPQSEETLNMMLFDQGVLRAPFQSFLVDDDKIRMVIILNGDITDQEIDAISDALYEITDESEMNDSILISGKPILDTSIKGSMMDSMKLMMIFAVIMMVLILLFVYKVRFRLLPIFMIMIAVVATVGIMGWLSIGLTMVSMAVFPVLIGLGIDYFIQFQTRYEEERRG